MKEIDRLVELSRVAIQNNSNLKEKHGVKGGISIGESSSNAYLDEAASLRDEMRKYLEGLSTDTIGRLEVIMYFGRDSEDVHGNDLPDLLSQ